MSRKKIILASQSKRRSEILASCGIEHSIVVTGTREIQPKKKHLVSSVMKNAERKVMSAAKAARDSGENAIIIGADTLVSLGSEVIGKPKDEREARALLSRFSGSEVDVYTGLFVYDTGTSKYAFGHEKSSITVRRIDPARMGAIFRKLGPYDKAGGFSIEGVGSMLFDNIRGSYFNILGLPMGKLADLFTEIGHDIFNFCA